MDPQDIQDRFELKHLVDHFSNLADEKKVAEQMPLFANDAEVITYIGGGLFAHAQGQFSRLNLSKLHIIIISKTLPRKVILQPRL